MSEGEEVGLFLYCDFLKDLKTDMAGVRETLED